MILEYTWMSIKCKLLLENIAIKLLWQYFPLSQGVMFRFKISSSVLSELERAL